MKWLKALLLRCVPEADLYYWIEQSMRDSRGFLFDGDRAHITHVDVSRNLHGGEPRGEIRISYMLEREL